MFRRLTALLVIWVNLLGMAHPALACSIDALDSDCCGAGLPWPGDLGAQNSNGVAAGTLCCLASTTAAPSVSVDATRPQPEAAHGLGSPDPIVLLSWSLA